MRIPFFAGVNRRPALDTQNTGRDAYARPLSPANVTVNGAGGFANFRSLSPVSPSSFNNPLVATVDLRGTGNEFNTNPDQEPLSDRVNSNPNRTQF